MFIYIIIILCIIYNLYLFKCRLISMMFNVYYSTDIRHGIETECLANLWFIVDKYMYVQNLIIYYQQLILLFQWYLNVTDNKYYGRYIYSLMNTIYIYIYILQNV